MVEPGKFDVIYIDPPWEYNSRAVHADSRFGGGANAQYPTMTDTRLLELGPKFQALAADRCIMFIWAVNPKMDMLLDFVHACGFVLKTKGFCWVKIYKNAQTPFIGPGYYTASNTEDCWIAVRGRSMEPAERLTGQIIYDPDSPSANGLRQIDGPAVWLPNNDLVVAPTREHSRKPDIVRERLKVLYPQARRLEIFCRYPAPGWSAIGNEIDGLDIEDALDLAAQGYYDL